MKLYADSLWYIHYPEFLTLRERLSRFLSSPKKMALKSNRIIASSFSTKDDLVRYWGVRESAVEVQYPARALRFINPTSEDIEFIKNKYNLPPSFFLFWDNGDGPVQNKKGLCRAFKSFKRSCPRGNTELLSLPSEEITPDYRNIISRLALATIFPHFYLGSSILLTEALAAQSPIIASQSGAGPEILNDAAILIDPLRLEELAFYMRELSSDGKLRLVLQEKSTRRFQELSEMGVLK